MGSSDQTSLTLSSSGGVLTDVLRQLTPRSHILNALQLIIDTHSLVSVSDRAGHIIYANDRFCEVSKYTREELIGQTHRIIRSDYHPPSFYEEMWSAISSGDTWNGDIQNKAKDGSIYWVQSSINPIFDKKNRIVGYGSVRTDVTAQRQLMVEFQDNEQKAHSALRSAIDALNDGITIFDKDNKIITSNKKRLEMYPEAKDILKPGNSGIDSIKRIMPELTDDEARRKMEEFRTTETRAIRKLSDGRTVRVTRKPTAEGGFISLHTDITDLVRQTKLLEIHAATVDLMKAIAVDANESADVESAYTSCLERICKFTGWEVGHVYLPCDDGSGRCRPSDHWYCAGNGKFQPFREQTQSTIFDNGIGLPGRVFQSGKPVWPRDVTADANFPRAKTARQSGIVGGAAFPVKIREEVVAILEFYSSQSIEPNPQLEEILSHVCTQMSRVAERDRLEKSFKTRVAAELQKRDRKLVEQNQRFDAALKNMTQGLCMFDKEQRLIVSNDRYAQMYDLPPQLLEPGITLRQIIEYRIANGIFAGENPEEYIEERQQWVTSGVYSNKVQELSDGRSISITHQPMPGGGWLTTHEDITERRKAEKALQESQELSSKAFRTSPAAIAITEPADGSHLDVNESWTTMLGYSHEEAMNSSALSLNTWAIPEARGRFVEQLGAEGSVRDFETTYRTKDGSLIDVLVSGEQVEIGGQPRLLVVSHDISERKKADKALQESQELFSKAFSASPAAIAISDPDSGVILDVNGAWTKMLGFSREEAMTNSAYQLGMWVNVQERYYFVEQVRVHGSVKDMEAKYRTKDGRQLDILVSGEQVEIGGQPRLLVVSHDISERKKADKALRESQELFSKAFSSSPAAMAISDPDSGAILDVNGAWTKMLGFSREEATSKTVRDLGFWVDFQERARFIDVIDKEGSAKEIETTLRAKDGRIISVVSYGERVEVGGLPRLLFVSHDITERKKAAEALRESEKRFKDIVEISSDWIWECDENLRFTYLSERFSQVTSVPKERVLGKTRHEIGKDAIADWDSHLADLEARKPFRAFNYAVNDENGETRHWTISGRPVFDADGSFKGYRGTGADRTAEVRSEAELIRHRDHLQDLVNEATGDLRTALAKEKELNEIQRQFVSMASHEFRTPLAIIDSAAQRLLRRVEDLTPEDTVKRVEKIRGAVGRMTQLMESTLDAARIEEGKINIEVGECDLRYVILEVAMQQIELSPNHNITSDLKELPDLILGDKGAFSQIFSNLVSNAVKYSPDTSDIHVKGWREGEFAMVEVTDHGLGIDEDDMTKMFQRFFRAKTSTGIAGTGIGLNLVKTLVELHEGSIEVQSAKAKGSVFTVRLPIQGPANAEITDGQAA